MAAVALRGIDWAGTEALPAGLLACAAGESYTGRPERSMVFYNIGGTFEATPSWQEPDSAYALDVTWDDVDLDGDQDLLFCGIIGANRLYLKP